MQYHRLFSCILFISVGLVACQEPPKAADKKISDSPHSEKGTFAYDVDFLKVHHPDMILLGSKADGPRVLVLPAYQGRVMTSTTKVNTGRSFGWINYDLIANQTPQPHFHAFGGEDRIWLGPEGGQFSIFFKPKTDFVFDNWFVPKAFDTEPFQLVESSADQATFKKELQLTNYSGTGFDVGLQRTVRLLTDSMLFSLLGMTLPGDCQAVAFESENTITNLGKQTWNKSTGLLSIWILSMLQASDSTCIGIPFRPGSASRLGGAVTDDYFGKVPGDRLKVEEQWVVMKADGHYRSKIGISPRRVLPFMASYDAAHQVLTLANYSLYPGSYDYVNSLWQLQAQPYAGDAVNAYNDGPMNGTQMGLFYELESSSKAAALAPGAHFTHIHRTIHLTGSRESLDEVTRKVLGVGLEKFRLP